MKRFSIMVFVIALAGCGSWMHHTDTVATPAYPANTTVIDISPTQFSPGNVTVKAGNTIYWRNNDQMTHRIVLDDRRYDSSDIAPGTIGCGLMLSDAGTHSYHDLNHPSMTGTITVTQ